MRLVPDLGSSLPPNLAHFVFFLGESLGKIMPSYAQSRSLIRLIAKAQKYFFQSRSEIPNLPLFYESSPPVQVNSVRSIARPFPRLHDIFLYFQMPPQFEGF